MTLELTILETEPSLSFILLDNNQSFSFSIDKNIEEIELKIFKEDN